MEVGPNVSFDSSLTEILCLAYHTTSGYFFCGHRNGNISGWVRDTKFIACSEVNKIHDGVYLRLT
jgi:hypothetical protein